MKLNGEAYMKGFKRVCAGLTSFLLACLLLMTVYAAKAENCPGGCAHEAAVGTTHYDSLAEAIAAAEAGSTVALLTDVTVSGGLTLDKALTLDLGGKTLTGQKTDNTVFLTVTDALTVKNGTVTMNGGSLVKAEKGSVTLEKTAAFTASTVSPVLQLQDSKAELMGTVSNESLGVAVQVSGVGALTVSGEAQVKSAQGDAIAMEGAGSLEISGGTLQAGENTLVLNVEKDKAPELSVTGGTFLPRNGETVVLRLGEEAAAPLGFITGGTFSKVPSDYLASNCVTRENSDATVTVIARYTITFQSGGGFGTMIAMQFDSGAAVTLPESTFVAPDGKHFAAWEAGDSAYAPGESLKTDGDLTLTARWEAHSGGKATCEKKAECDICGEKYGKLAAHKLEEVPYTAPTCTASGNNAHSKCSVCGGRFVDGVKISLSALTIPEDGHEWLNVEGLAATCETQGLRDHKQCENCGQLRMDGSTVDREELIVPASGHVLIEVPSVEASCTQAGVRAHEYCTGCGQHFLHGYATEQADLTTALAAHVLSDWQGDESYHWKSCVDCDTVFRLGGHTDADQSGSCDECDAPMAAQKQEAPAQKSGFGWLWLLPLLIALAVAVLLVLKKRKTANV